MLFMCVRLPMLCIRESLFIVFTKKRLFMLFTFTCTLGKGKAIPLQSWTGPEDSRRLRFPDFKTIGIRKW